MPNMLCSSVFPVIMKYQSLIEFMGVYLNLAMNIHVFLIILNFITSAGSSGLGFTNWIEFIGSVIWIVLQILLAIRHGKAGFLPFFFLYTVTTPAISIYLSFFTYQRLDDFNWGTR